MQVGWVKPTLKYCKQYCEIYHQHDCLQTSQISSKMVKITLFQQGSSFSIIAGIHRVPACNNSYKTN